MVEQYFVSTQHIEAPDFFRLDGLSQLTGDWQKAMEQIRDQKPGIVLVDIYLQEGNYQEIIGFVKNAYPAAKCILLARSEWQLPVDDVGFDAVIYKHEHVCRIVQVIKGLCKAREAEDLDQGNAAVNIFGLVGESRRRWN